MVRHDHGGLGAFAELVQELRSHHHNRCLAAPNRDLAQRVAFNQDAPDQVKLIVICRVNQPLLPEPRHAGEVIAEMAAVISSGSSTVKLVVVELGQLVSPFSISPDPALECLLDLGRTVQRPSSFGMVLYLVIVFAGLVPDRVIDDRSLLVQR